LLLSFIGRAGRSLDRLVRLKGDMANKSNVKNNFQWLQLQEGAETDKFFDGVSAGTFIDFYGRRFTIAAKDLPKIIENTLRVIQSGTTESGELVGLPIDVANHDNGDGAGWIKSLELDETRNVIRLLPKWNELGRNLIGENIRRYFSPTIDLAQKVIMGGTLTNWPASRDGTTGEILLRPIELSQGVYAMSINKDIANLTDGSLMDLVNKVFNAFMDQYGTNDWSCYPMDIFDEYIIASSDNKLFKVTYLMDADGNVEFAPVGEWVEVEMTYVEASMEPASKSKFNLSDFIARLIKGSGGSENNIEKGKVDMTSKSEQNEINTTAPAVPDMVALVNGASEAELAQLAENPAIAKLIETRTDAAVALQKRAADVAQFSKAVALSEDKKAGLPVPSDRLEKFLLSLNDEQLKEAREIFEHIAKTGFVSLSEQGHGAIVTGTKPLPTFVQASLEVVLKAGGTVENFFKENAAELGDMRDYDLSAFVQKPKDE
jgi:hypothetical protein